MQVNSQFSIKANSRYIDKNFNVCLHKIFALTTHIIMTNVIFHHFSPLDIENNNRHAQFRSVSTAQIGFSFVFIHKLDSYVFIHEFYSRER